MGDQVVDYLNKIYSNGIPAVVSGQPVTISGDHIFMESGAHVITQPGIQVSGTVGISGTITAEVASGLHVWMSGQHVFVESGSTPYPFNPETDDDNIPGGEVRETPIALCYAYDHEAGNWVRIRMENNQLLVSVSGIVTIASGIVDIQSGLHVWMSGQHVFVESGVHVVGDFSTTTDISGQISGQPVTISGDHIFMESGAHVITQPGIQVSGAVIVSGDFSVASGLHVWVSGQHMYQESGACVTIQSGGEVNVVTPTVIDIGNFVSGNLTNPMPVDSESGGVPLHSGAVISVVVKALSANSGDIYLGGCTVGQCPLSGYGLLVEAGEAVNIDIDNIGKVHAYAEVSGDKVTYLANA